MDKPSSILQGRSISLHYPYIIGRFEEGQLQVILSDKITSQYIQLRLTKTASTILNWEFIDQEKLFTFTNEKHRHVKISFPSKGQMIKIG